MLEDVLQFIESNNGIGDKMKLAAKVQSKFCCIKDRSVYATDRFAVRFCMAKSAMLSNTVLSLSALQKYDDKPFLVCVVTPKENFVLLANSTFIAKISHSSKELRVDNIKGSFNGSDIIRSIEGITNEPRNFNILFPIHKNYTFEENLVRLVEVTNNIAPTGVKFDVNTSPREQVIMDAPKRAVDFVTSPQFLDLLTELDKRTIQYQNEIFVAACIENVNLRGRIIEYIIAGESEEMREQIIESICNGIGLPHLITRDGIGDYTKFYPMFHTETDIKTKIMVLASAPKGYNLDKMLEFLAKDKSVFLIYFIGIDYEQKKIKTKLISMFHNTLLAGTIIQSHWAGRNSRGVSQFNGEVIKKIILHEENCIDISVAKNFLERIILR